MAGRPGATLAESGERLSEIGDLTTDIAERVRKAQDTLALTKAGNEITAAFDKYQQTLAISGDPDHMPDAQQWTDALRKQFAQNPMYADPRVQRAIGLNIDSVGIEAQKHMFARRLTLQTQEMDAQLTVLHQNAAFQAAEAWDDPQAYQKALDSFEIPAHAAEATGFITAKEHSIQSQSLKAAAEDVHLVNAINREQPDAMQAVLDDADEHPERYKDLDPKRFSELKKYLRTAIDTARERVDRVDVANQGDVILAKMRNDATNKDVETKDFDPLVAAKKVDDDPNIPTNVKKYVRTELEEEAGVQRQLRNERDQYAIDSLEPHVESSPKDDPAHLTFQEITRRALLPPQSPEWIPRTAADHLLSRAAQIQRENRIEGNQDRMMARQQAAEDSAEQMRFLMVTPGFIANESELYQGDNLKLSKADRATVWVAKNIKGSKEYQDAYKMMAASPVYPQTDDGNARLARDAETLRQAIDAKHLTGAQIIDEAQKMMKPKEEAQRSRTIKAFMDNIWPIARGLMTGQGFYDLKIPEGSAPSGQPAPPQSVVDSAREGQYMHSPDGTTWQKQNGKAVLVSGQ